MADQQAKPLREVEADEVMSDHETMMWNLEQDPWLNPSGAALVMLDRPIDLEHFMAKMRFAVTKLPRLHQRVVSNGPLSNPRWEPDPDFDLDHHIRTVSLSGSATKRDLLDLAATLYDDPLDRSKPLWRFVAIDGLESGGAVWMIMHHVISDGIGQMRMAELYQSLDPDEPAPDPVDLDAFIAESVAAHAERRPPSDDGARSAVKSAARLLKDTLDAARDVAAEVALWPADPSRVTDKAGDAYTTARSLFDQVAGTDQDDDAGAPLWSERSAQRHLEHINLPVDRLKAAVKSHGASINDGFLAGLIAGSARYHAERDAPAEAFNASFIVSTRKGKTAGGNSFTPVALSLPAADDLPIDERLRDISARVAAAKDAVMSSGGSISTLAGAINLIPVSIATRAARAKAADIDLATSNLRGAPIPLYVSGAHVLGTAIQGPLAGTPCNATALSTENSFDIGLHVDPIAIADPGEFRRCVADAFTDLLALA